MSKEKLEEAKNYFIYWINSDLSLGWQLSEEAKLHLKYIIEQAERYKGLVEHFAKNSQEYDHPEQMSEVAQSYLDRTEDEPNE